jgi:hypothetical protein
MRFFPPFFQRSYKTDATYFYGCKTWRFALRTEHEIILLRNILGPEMEVNRIPDADRSPSVRVLKWRRTRLTELVTTIEDKYCILAGEGLGKITLGRTRRIRER